MDWGSVAGAGLTAVCSLIGVYIANRKSAALMEYRLKKLEEKVDKHNSLVERMTVVETKLADMQKGA